METDARIVYYLQTHRIAALDGFLQGLTAGVSVLTALILLWLAYAVWRQRQRPPRDFWLLGLSLLFTAALVHLLKWWVARPRPFAEWPQIDQLALGGQGSFPSGHTAEVFTLLFALWPLTRSPFLRFLLLAWALLIAYTRMALGVHYPTDVLGGIAVAALSVWAARRILESRRMGESEA